MITAYLICCYIIMLNAVIKIKTIDKLERFLMFIFAPISLLIFMGFVLALFIDELESR